MPTQAEDEYARAVLRYVARKYGRHEIAAQAAIHKLERDSFWLQQAFIRDPEHMVACRTGRRGGKTTAIERKILRAALRRPRAFSAYIALTRRNAKLLLWPELLALNSRYGIGGKANIADLTLTLPNGHIIVLGGADTASEIDKYRQYRFTTAAVDEAGTFGPWLKSLVEDVLEPATLDEQGQILVCGTPGPVCEGYYYDITGNPETKSRHVKQHRWTVLQNPFIPHAQRWLERLCKERGWAMDHPTLRREYYGEWVADHTALAYHFDPSMLWDGQLPESRWPWEHTLSIDVGYDDPTAFALIAHNREVPACYVRWCIKEAALLPSQIAARIEEYMRNYSITRIVADLSGGGGKGQIEEWRQRFGIPLHVPPSKQMKKEHIALMNDDAKNGKLFIHRDKCNELIREYQTVCWTDDRSKPDDKYANDCLDAVEYGWASSLHYASATPPRKRDSMSIEERYAQEEDELERSLHRSLRGSRRRL